MSSESLVNRARITASQRALEIQPFYVMEAARAAQEREAAGHDILHLEVGQPSTPAPKLVRDAAAAAIETSLLGYTGPEGLPKLRKRLVEWYRTNHDVEITVDQILVTPGASGSCTIAFLGLWNPGDRVGLIEPGYPCYRNDLVAFGIDAVAIPVDASTDFRPTIELLDAAGPLDGLVLASPSNPTGTVLDAELLAAILAWADERGVTVVVDEIYHGLTYGEPAVSALRVAADVGTDVVVFNSFSKYYSMTGWRLGWLIVPEYLATPMGNLAANLIISPSTLSQLAAIAAFDATDECEANVDRYRENREILLAGLPAAGLDKIAPPDGAFYIWADVSHLVGPETGIINTQELCTRWLHDIGVAATPGIDFDPVRGGHFVRFSYAGSSEDMRDAVERLRGWQP